MLCARSALKLVDDEAYAKAYAEARKKRIVGTISNHRPLAQVTNLDSTCRDAPGNQPTAQMTA